MQDLIRKFIKLSGESSTGEEKLREIDDGELSIPEDSMYIGPNSEAYQGTYYSRPVFVKRFPAAEQVYFNEEATILSKLNHENIVKFIGIRRNKEYNDIVTEFLQGGTLKALFDNCRLRSQPLPLWKAIGYALDIARAMEYVHHEKIIHRDLKPENVLLTENQGRAVLIDFGHSTKKNVDGMTGDVGSLRWMAPEVMFQEGIIYYDHKVDVFSFSIVLWELITGKIPYQEKEKPMEEILDGIRTHEIRPSMKDVEIPEKLDTLLKSSWAADPADRPEFSKITTTLEELLRTLDPAQTTARMPAVKEQPGDGEGRDATGTQEKEAAKKSEGFKL